jgi:hypothetical protein
MEIDTRFPTKLNTVYDAPESFRGALVENLGPSEPIRLLVHAPAFATADEKSPATVLAVANNGWLVISENEDGSANLQKSDFSDTLFLELTSILLLGQLRIAFGAGDTSRSVAIKFDAAEDELYREAIDLILAGIDPALPGAANKDHIQAQVFRDWSMKFRNEAQRYCPKGQRLMAAVEWRAIFGNSPQQLAPAGALLITERALVVISDEQNAAAERPPETSSADEPKETLGGIITFIPRLRLADFHVSHHEGFGVLALRLHAAHGEEKLEVKFSSDDEKAVSTALEQMLLLPGPGKSN